MKQPLLLSGAVLLTVFGSLRPATARAFTGYAEMAMTAINMPPQISPTIVQISASGPTALCKGNSVILTANNSDTKKQYLWNTGATNAAITVTSAGVYKVTVTNSFGSFTAAQPVSVNPLPAPVVSANGTTTFCVGNSVTLTASGGNKFAWSTGETDAAIIVKKTDTYAVTVTNSGCSNTAGKAVTVLSNFPAAQITTSGPSSFCAGSKVTLTATGADMYLWSTGQTTAAITVAGAANYKVTAINKGGCSTVVSNAVNVYPLPAAKITANGPTTFCAGGAITLTASGGNAFLWNTGETNATITVNSSNTYSATVTNANGCAATVSQPITVIPFTAQITPSNAAPCAGSSVTLTASNGNSYIWSTGETTAAIAVTSPANYTVTITNASGCIKAATRTVNFIPAPNAQITSNYLAQKGPLSFCAGGSIIITASGGNKYLWSTGQSDASIIVNSSSNYTVTVTAANGCSNSASLPVVVNPLPVVQITANGPTSLCSGGSVLLTASGGIGYNWGNKNTQPGILVSTSGNYRVIVTDKNGCTNTGRQQVTINPLPAAQITANGPTTFCAGGAITITAAGGNKYLWNTGQSEASIIVNSSNDYIVTVTNAQSGCAGITDLNVTVNPLPAAQITAGGPTTICTGDQVQLTAGGGTNYAWSTEETTPNIIVMYADKYIVTVSDNITGCSKTVSQSVTVNPAPPAIITANGPTTFNPGGSVKLTASGGNHFLWNNGRTDACIIVTQSNSYVVTVTNANGCSNVSSPVNVDSTGGQGLRKGGVSINTLTAIPDLILYPNPAKDAAYLTYTLPEAANALVELYNILGVKVKTLTVPQKAGENTILINTGDLAAGTYTVSLSTNNERRLKQLVIDK